MNQRLLQSAWQAHQSGNLAEAARLYSEILRTDPVQFDALYGLGILHYQRGDFGEAERTIAKAAERNPRLAEPWFTRGCALHRLDRSQEALAAFDRALSIKPAFAEALINKGSLLIAAKRYTEALASFEVAIAVNPAFAEAWNNRGTVLSELGRHRDAVESYDRVLQIRPGVVETLINRGTALLALGRFAEALASYEEALTAGPRSASALTGRANALFALKRYEEAARDYGAAFAIEPESPYALGNRAFCNLHCCAWRSLNDDKARITAGLAAHERIVNPFQSLALCEASENQLRAAALWMGDKYPGASREPWRGERYRNDKIRIAYLSADFTEHAVATTMAGVFEHHDKERFETIALSLKGRDETAMRARLKRTFDRFIDIENRSDTEAAEMLRAMEVDIAVDLMGFTGECRPGILALRPAPVQVNYLGFPGTMGASHIDYILADRTVLPEASWGYYAENVAYLANSYLPNDATRSIADQTPPRGEAGLPDTGFVFASFNSSYKFSPAIFTIWMRLLHGIGTSVLWLPHSNPAAVDHLKREAEKRGIAGERLVFAPFIPKAEDHLARLKCADLFLDTLPYNAHTSACDALWAGVPVITCMGSAFAGRVGASLLNAIGLPELIAGSLAEYEALALKLARDGAMLSTLKAKLHSHRSTHPLFDTQAFTRDLESLYIKMWTRQQRGAPPGPIV
jgi:protein O-GlcNAc transferase